MPLTVVAYYELFNFILEMEATEQFCSLDQLVDTICHHTGYGLEDLIGCAHRIANATTLYASYKDFWDEAPYGMLVAITAALTLRLCGPDPDSNISPGKGWKSLAHRVHDHLTHLYKKRNNPSYYTLSAKAGDNGIFEMLFEFLRTMPKHSLFHDQPGPSGRTLKQYQQLLRRPAVLQYEDELGGVIRPGK